MITVQNTVAVADLAIAGGGNSSVIIGIHSMSSPRSFVQRLVNLRWLVPALPFVLMNLVGCGGSKTTTNTPQLTGIAKRVLLSNQQPSATIFDGSVTIMNGANDTFSTKALPSNGASKMVTGGGVTVVLNHNFA
ncbi:MAG TPA: hypothetical protein VEW69_03960, partial [Alphaproteobacteria bacterium]|nr:hypothetical protein [Alphaproteobacteria bacterium]